MSLERTWMRRRGDTSKKRREGKKVWGFCKICIEPMKPESLEFHMLAKHGIFIDKEDRYDKANGTGGQRVDGNR